MAICCCMFRLADMAAESKAADNRALVREGESREAVGRVLAARAMRCCEAQRVYRQNIAKIDALSLESGRQSGLLLPRRRVRRWKVVGRSRLGSRRLKIKIVAKGKDEAERG